MMEKLPENKPNETVIYSPIIKQKKRVSGAFVDTFLLVATILIFLAVIASYFVIVDVNAEISRQQLTVNVIWLAIGTFAIGALTKRYTLNLGRKTDEYKQSQVNARERIDELCKSPCAQDVHRYTKYYIENAVFVFRQHTLSLVGLDYYEDYKNKYLGKGRIELKKIKKAKEITSEQYFAILKCNKLKIKPYNENFLLSYDADLNVKKPPSEMFNIQHLNTADTFKSIILTVLSSLFIGELFSSVVLNMTPEAVFECVIKVIMVLINVAYKASTGWGFAVMEQNQNNLRASETLRCTEWIKTHPIIKGDNSKNEQTENTVS